MCKKVVRCQRGVAVWWWGRWAKELAGVPEQLDKQPTQSRKALHRAKVTAGSVIVMYPGAERLPRACPDCNVTM